MSTLPPHIAAVILLTQRPRKPRKPVTGPAQILTFPVIARPRG
jgi:hypothetical protein